MTGFGRGEYVSDKFMIAVEIKTVNHRYRDFFIKMPKQFNCFEDKLRTVIGNKILRGRIEIYISIKFLKDKPVNIYLDPSLAKQYYDILNQIGSMFEDIEKDIKISNIARFSDVIKSDEDTEKYIELWEYVKAAIDDALIMLCVIRQREGLYLQNDIINKCESIKVLLKKVEEEAESIPKACENKINDVLSRYNIKEIDTNRFATEIAFLAERASIDEEITRLKTHIQALENTLGSKGDIGRKLDFILQEMNREANTIASKSNSASISMNVVDIKSNIEKIREQVQNIE
jgi:uncharacterized protein (TIGR00255 family)